MLNALKNAFFTTFIALIIIGPIISFTLQGFAIDFEIKRSVFLALIVFFGVLTVSLLKTNKKVRLLLTKINNQFKEKTFVAKCQVTHPGWLWGIGVLSIILPFFIGKYWLSVACLCLIYVLLGLGLNIVVGLAGLLNLGFVAFYAIGAYTYALGAEYLGLGFWSALPLGALVAGAFGALLSFPVLRLYGDYLAIVTLGFGEILRLILVNWGSFTGGPNGLEIVPLSFFGLTFHSSERTLFVYFMLLITVCLVLRLINRLRHMPLGRSFEALREDEIACRSLGINHVTTKLMAFSLGAMIGGLGGVYFAALEGFVDPASFTFIESALILSIVVLGGMGSTLGVVIAALILTLLPEFLRGIEEYRMLIFGALLVMMMIWRPQGLIKFARFAYSRPIRHDHDK